MQWDNSTVFGSSTPPPTRLFDLLNSFLDLLESLLVLVHGLILIILLGI